MSDIKIVEELANKFGARLFTYNQTNKLGKLYLEFDRTSEDNKPNYELYKAIEESPIFNCLISKSFKVGKKIENCSKYTIIFSVKKAYYNGNLTSGLTGDFLKFCFENNITSTREFMENTIEMISDMSSYCHVTKDKDERKKLRQIKKNYIKFLYNHKLVNKCERQLHYRQDFKIPDKLVMFYVEEKTFHLRETNIDFISCIDNLPMNDMLYKSKEMYQVRSEKFMDFIKIFENINNNNLWLNAELETNYIYSTLFSDQ